MSASNARLVRERPARRSRRLGCCAVLRLEGSAASVLPFNFYVIKPSALRDLGSVLCQVG